MPRVWRHHPQRREDIHASEGGMESLQRKGRQGGPGVLSSFILCAGRMDRMEGLCKGACRGSECTGGQEGRTPPHLHEHHRRPSLLQGSHRLVGVEGHLREGAFQRIRATEDSLMGERNHHRGGRAEEPIRGLRVRLGKDGPLHSHRPLGNSGKRQ